MPKVSVVILNWNGKHFLKDCLTSLCQADYPRLEIILVDNNSSDGSQAYVKKYFSKVKLVCNKQNYGFAKSNNLGYRKSSGDYILFLNNDTQVTPDFLKPLIEDFQKNPKLGCVQPQMLTMKDKELLDEAGAYLTFTGFLYHYGYRKDHRSAIYQTRRRIFTAKGACMLIARSVLDKTGGFDEDFFIFFEETDLCHRIWLAGWEVVYEPRSTIYHLAGGDTRTTYDRAKRIYLTFKNMNYSYIKNFGYFHLLTIYPIFILSQMMLISYFLFTGKLVLVGSMFRAYGWNIFHLPTILEKRRHVQRVIRKVTDREIDSHIRYNPDLYYYYCLLFHAAQYKDKMIDKSL